MSAAMVAPLVAIVLGFALLSGAVLVERVRAWRRSIDIEIKALGEPPADVMTGEDRAAAMLANKRAQMMSAGIAKRKRS